MTRRSGCSLRTGNIPIVARETAKLKLANVYDQYAGKAVSIGLTSYDGCVYYGLNADRDAMPDLDVLGQCLVDALAELVAGGR